ncbi:crossover junction endodeoxyribonuclease RuvC [Caldicellulosiruptoraceae bacterium PP1]
MRVIGIDPGIALTGYAIVDYKNGQYRVIEYDKIETLPNMRKSQRLFAIHNRLSDIISKYNPDVAAIEELFFNKNAKTVITVGESRGVIILSFVEKGIPIYEYTPLQVKQSITGYGRATKVQIQNVVKMLLNLKEVPKPDDVADALAVSICHLNNATSLISQEEQI